MAFKKREESFLRWLGGTKCINSWSTVLEDFQKYMELKYDFFLSCWRWLNPGKNYPRPQGNHPWTLGAEHFLEGVDANIERLIWCLERVPVGSRFSESKSRLRRMVVASDPCIILIRNKLLRLFQQGGCPESPLLISLLEYLSRRSWLKDHRPLETHRGNFQWFC